MCKRKSRKFSHEIEEIEKGYFVFDPDGKPIRYDEEWCPSVSPIGVSLVAAVQEGTAELKFGWVPMTEIDRLEEFWTTPSGPRNEVLRAHFKEIVEKQGHARLWLYERNGRLVMFDNYGFYQAALDLGLSSVVGVLLGPVKNPNVKTFTKPLSTKDAKKFVQYGSVDLRPYLLTENG